MTNETFKLIRLYSKMSQQEFADHIGVSKATVSLIETDRREVTARVRAKLAEKFDLTDSFFEYVRKYNRLSQ